MPDPSDAPSVALPAPRLTLPARGEEMLTVRVADWSRLRRTVEGLRKSRRDFSATAWAAVGVSVSGFLTLIPWIPAYGTLNARAKIDFAWVTPLLAVVGTGAAVLAVLAFVGAHILAKRERLAADELADDMDEVFEAVTGRRPQVARETKP